MFNLPQDIQRYIYEFCHDKWENMDKVLNQFLKGGFNRISYNIKNFIKNEKKLAINASNYRYSRKSKVTNWLRNIEKFENTHPEVATYLSKKELEVNFKIALKRREEIKAKKLHIKNENIRAQELYEKCERYLKQQFLTEYFHGQELRLPINALRPNKNWTNHTWEEDETIDCDICTCKIDSVYGKNPGNSSDYRAYWAYQKMRFNEKWVKQHIELQVILKFNNGCYRHYSVKYLKQRIELSKHYGVENKLSCNDNHDEAELEIIEIGNCKYLYDEKGLFTDIKNLLLNMEAKPIGIYNKETEKIYFCEFEEC